jgi:hypothetical protein
MTVIMKFLGCDAMSPGTDVSDKPAVFHLSGRRVTQDKKNRRKTIP